MCGRALAALSMFGDLRPLYIHFLVITHRSSRQRSLQLQFVLQPFLSRRVIFPSHGTRPFPLFS